MVEATASKYAYVKSVKNGCSEVNMLGKISVFGKLFNKVQNLSKRELAIAVNARDRAINYLEDLIVTFFEGKSDQECKQDMGQFLMSRLKPQGFKIDDLLFSGRGDIFNITRENIQKVIDTLKKIRFARVTGREAQGVFAYVYPDDETLTVHLCDAFWPADRELSIDSQPGTLIHEVSHFEACLGTDDVFLDRVQYYNSLDNNYTRRIVDRINAALLRTQGEGQFSNFIEEQQIEKFISLVDSLNASSLEVGAYSSIEMLNQFAENQNLSDNEKKAFYILMWYQYFNNANNLEYEIEIRFNHDGRYIQTGQVWTCCNHNVKYSICRAPYVFSSLQTTENDDRMLTLNLKVQMMSFLYPPNVRDLKNLLLALKRGFRNPIIEKLKLHLKFKTSEAAQPIKPGDKVKIGILGGGISALYTALIIKYLNERKGFNIDFEIIEKSNRVGGRLKTQYLDQQLKQIYQDMGIMYVPASHTPVYDLIDFVNEKIQEKNQTLPPTQQHSLLEVVDYFVESIDVNSVGVQYPQVNQNGKRITYHTRFTQEGFSFQESDIVRAGDEKQPGTYTDNFNEEQISYLKRLNIVKNKVETLLKALSQQMNDLLRQKARTDIREQENLQNLYDKIDDFYLKYGQYSVFSYLMNSATNNEFGLTLTPEDIADYESVFGTQTLLEHNLIDYLVLNDGTNTSDSELLYGRGPLNQEITSQSRPYNTLKGGLQTLSDAILWLIGEKHVTFNASIEKVTAGEQVEVSYKQFVSAQLKTKLFDKVIVAIPSSACANIEWKGSLFPEAYNRTMKSFRTVNQMPIYKLSLQFSERFWENTALVKPDYALIGGKVNTELSSRQFIFPSYGYEEGYKRQGSIMIYNWSGDAERWSRLSEDEQVHQAIEDLNTYFNSIKAFGVKKFDILNDYFTGQYCSSSQTTVPASGDAFLGPYQYKLMRWVGKGLEGKVFFGNELLSLHKGEILGSLQSATQAIRSLVGKDNFDHYLIPWQYDSANQSAANGKSIRIFHLKEKS